MLVGFVPSTSIPSSFRSAAFARRPHPNVVAMIVTAALAGLPLALVLGWFFDLAEGGSAV